MPRPDDAKSDDRNVRRPASEQAGEDDGGVATDGRDDHLKDDQKPTSK